MLSLFISFFISFILCFLIIRYRHLHDHITSDPVQGGPQKFHTDSTPRIGGVAICMALLAVGILFFLQKKDFAMKYIVILLCSFPAFLGGLLEDLTKKISPKIRLSLCVFSGILLYFFADATIERVDLPLVDDALKYVSFSLILTILAISGFSNAMNIIDGFNGLASGVSMIILTGLAYVAFKVNDTCILFSSVVLIAAIFGFFIWNYPRAFIFLGDSGAYLLGTLIATLSILLVRRNPQVSAWFPLLLLIYPVWETIFSIYRRKFKKGLSFSVADRLHFHSLMYKRIVRFAFGPMEARYLTWRNSATSVYLWGLTFLSFIPAVLFWQSGHLLQIFTFLWIFLYVWLYRRIVRFKGLKI